MLFDIFSSIVSNPVLAEAAVTWTPKTFYIASAIMHVVIYLLGFKFLQADPEHNTFIGALIAAVIANFASFVLRDYGLFGILSAGSIHFIVLVAISSGEVLKSVVVFFVAMAAYALLGFYVTPRTPLTVDEIGGLPRVIMTGGIEAEPITEEDADKMAEPAGKKK